MPASLHQKRAPPSNGLQMLWSFFPTSQARKRSRFEAEGDEKRKDSIKLPLEEGQSTCFFFSFAFSLRAAIFLTCDETIVLGARREQRGPRRDSVASRHRFLSCSFCGKRAGERVSGGESGERKVGQSIDSFFGLWVFSFSFFLPARQFFHRAVQASHVSGRSPCRFSKNGPLRKACLQD